MLAMMSLQHVAYAANAATGITPFTAQPVDPASNATGPKYYVDCKGGDDRNTGLAPDQAWQSLQRLKSATLRPGESLLFKRGCAWTGPLILGWQGTAEQPIYVSAYGTGERPVIKDAEYNVWIKGSYLAISQLAARFTPTKFEPGCDNQAVGWSIGFRFEKGAAYNTLQQVEARSLTHGVKIANGSHHNTLIYNSFVDNTLMFALDRTEPSNDSGAVGIVLDGDDNEIAYNTFTGQDACSYDFERDGAAVEVYGGQRNVVHHNIAHNNNAFSELGNPRSADNTYAYNLVTADIADAHFLVTRGAESRLGPVLRTKVYNNTVYLRHPTSKGVNCDRACGTDILTLKNNIIWSEGTIGYIDTHSDEGHNVFWKSDGKPKVYFPNPQDMSSTSRKADPRFADLLQANLRPQSDSPALNTGTPDVLKLGFKTELDGIAVPQQQTIDIGAYEFTPLAKNLIKNGSFENYSAGAIAQWQLKVKSGAAATLQQVAAKYGVGSYAAQISVTQKSTSWYAQLEQTGITLEKGRSYTLSYWAKASAPRSIDVALQQANTPYSLYFKKQVELTTNWQQFKMTVVAPQSDVNTALRFDLAAATGQVWIDDVVLVQN